MRRASLIAAVLVWLCAGVAPARADEVTSSVGTIEHPHAPRVFHVPTGWLQPPGYVFASSGVNHRGGGLLAVSAGLGRLAELDVTLSDRFVQCLSDCDTEDRDTQHAWVGSALFKIGLGRDLLFRHQPAVALGFRKSFAAREQAPDLPIEPTLAELYLAVTLELGPVDLHVGGQMWDTEARELFSTLSEPRARARPFFGLSWRPEPYPRTMFLADFSWVPELQTNDAGDDVDTKLRWIGAWGVRYQALRWGSIELGVRHREYDGLRGSTVFVRLNATGSLRDALLSRSPRR